MIKNKFKPLSIEVTRRKWNLLEHIRRLDNKKTPAKKAMKLMFGKRSDKKYRGRKRATIYTVRALKK